MHTAERNRNIIIGVDEAGRGPLAGPVVSGAVIITERIEGVKDSKSLSEKKREALFNIIRERCVAFGVGIAAPEEIDRMNILNASLLSMKRAVDSLRINLKNNRMKLSKNVIVLVDGNKKIKDFKLRQKTVVKGDSKIYQISAASIVAKVVRDRMMCSFAKRYPQYNFCKHKGYPTKEHKLLIKKYGASAIHRKSFRGVNEQSLPW